MIQWIEKHEDFKHAHLLLLVKWLVLAGITGLLVGIIVTAFAFCLSFVTSYRTAHSLIIGLLPVAGLLIVFLYRKGGVLKPRGTNLVISSIRSEEPLPFVMAPLIFISTVITHLFGGSAGREGAALQLGGSIPQQLGRWFHLNEKDLKLMTMCGMAAAFAGLFQTPLTAVVFAMEVISVGIMHYSALVPCAIAATVAVQVVTWAGIAPETFVIANAPAFSLFMLVKVILLAVICAYLSVGFCELMHKTAHFFEDKFANPYLRIFVGGCVIVVLTLLVGTDYNGAGMNIIERAVQEGTTHPLAFLLKMIFTAITLGSGFKGGEIVPSFFVGACFGCLIGPWIGIPASFGAAVGLLVVFCGVTNCPMASLLLVFELFGFQNALLFLAADAVGYMMSGYYGLYSDQKIIYSKYETSFIDNNANHSAD